MLDVASLTLPHRWRLIAAAVDSRKSLKAIKVPLLSLTSTPSESINTRRFSPNFVSPPHRLVIPLIMKLPLTAFVAMSLALASMASAGWLPSRYHRSWSDYCQKDGVHAGERHVCFKTSIDRTGAIANPGSSFEGYYSKADPTSKWIPSIPFPLTSNSERILTERFG